MPGDRMSLKRALDRLPHDRQLQAVARDILALFARRPEDWIQVEGTSGHDQSVEHVEILRRGVGSVG